MLLEGKRAIVTGGSRGIGRGICLELARQGCDVALNYFSAADQGLAKNDAADEVVAEIEAMGRRAIAVEGNIADPAVSAELVQAAVDAFGGIDVLASNAGICPFHGFLDMPPELLQQVVGVNLKGAFYATQAAANRMKDQGTGGAIIAISSISALVGGAMQTHYTPTTAGVHSLMQSVAIVLGPHGIRCSDARRHRDRHQPGRLVGSEETGISQQPHSAGPFRRTAGRGQRRGFPCLRHGFLRHRRLAPRGRRPFRQSAIGTTLGCLFMGEDLPQNRTLSDARGFIARRGLLKHFA